MVQPQSTQKPASAKQLAHPSRSIPAGIRLARQAKSSPYQSLPLKSQQSSLTFSLHSDAGTTSTPYRFSDSASMATLQYSEPVSTAPSAPVAIRPSHIDVPSPLTIADCDDALTFTLSPDSTASSPLAPDLGLAADSPLRVQGGPPVILPTGPSPSRPTTAVRDRGPSPADLDRGTTPPLQPLTAQALVSSGIKAIDFGSINVMRRAESRPNSPPANSSFNDTSDS